MVIPVSKEAQNIVNFVFIVPFIYSSLIVSLVWDVIYSVNF
jgi:ABC-type sugar transport system permease subunit